MLKNMSTNQGQYEDPDSTVVKDRDDDKEFDKEDRDRDVEQLITNGDSNVSKENIDKDALADELTKVEQEIKCLKDTLVSKQRRAAEIRRLLGHNLVTDVKEKVKTLQESEMLMKTNQAFKSAGEKTSAAFSNIGKKFGDVRSRIGESLGSSINTVKAKVNGSKSDISDRSGSQNTKSATSSSTLDEDISLYEDLDYSPYD